MQRYQVTGPIVLGFITAEGQIDAIFKPGDDAIVESDGETIWIVFEGVRHTSTTIAYAVTAWLESGSLAPLADLA